jgi:phosphate:Na+ symporter
LVQSGVQRAIGSDLRRFLGHALGNRIKAAAAGLSVTAILQSSTATGLMIASFASAGFVALVPALAVMLGANVGTTLIVQALSFDVSRPSPLLLLGGVAMFRTGGARTRDIGRVAIGLGLMLIALSQLLAIVTPYEDIPSLRILMGAIATDRLISVGFGALLAWAAHSSVAVALLVMSFAEKGVIPLNAALALIIGANIGTAVNPLIEGARGGDAAGRRVVVGNVVMRLAGAAIALPLLTPIGVGLVQIEPSFSRAGRRFSHGVQLRSCAGVPAASRSPGARARATDASARRRRRPWKAALSRRRGAGDAVDRPRSRRQRSAADGRRPRFDD